MQPNDESGVINASAGGAAGVRWDLTLLAPSEEAMKERLEAAVAAADSFGDRWPADSIAAIEPDALAELLRELAELRAARMEGDRWVLLLAMTDAENPAVRDLRAWVDGRVFIAFLTMEVLGGLRATGSRLPASFFLDRRRSWVVVTPSSKLPERPQ